MGLFDTIRAILGLGGSDEREKTTVPIESGSDDSTGDAATSGAETDPGGTETSAAESAGTTGPASDADDEEPADGEDASTGSDETDAGSDETGEEEADTSTSHAADEETNASTASVSTISGIGPAYTERLAEAGVETVSDLLEADAAGLAAETDLSETRISGWQDTAAE